MKHFIILCILGAGLWACSDVYTITAVSSPTEVNDSVPSNSDIDSLIAPYRAELSESMDVVIAFAKHDYTKGRPNALLNNWAASSLLEYEIVRDTVKTALPIMCLLNTGGLRSPISEGNVTLGDMYKLMPFDNEVMWVEMPWESLVDIKEYLIEKGGEPIAGATLMKDTLLLDGVIEPTESFWVITSDYLMNGGDRMDFFEMQMASRYGTGLLRDAFIDAAKTQDTLDFNSNERIQL